MGGVGSFPPAAAVSQEGTVRRWGGPEGQPQGWGRRGSRKQGPCLGLEGGVGRACPGGAAGGLLAREAGPWSQPLCGAPLGLGLGTDRGGRRGGWGPSASAAPAAPPSLAVSSVTAELCSTLSGWPLSAFLLPKASWVSGRELSVPRGSLGVGTGSSELSEASSLSAGSQPEEETAWTTPEELRPRGQASAEPAGPGRESQLGSAPSPRLTAAPVLGTTVFSGPGDGQRQA